MANDPAPDESRGEYDPFNLDRDRGVLTTADRKYLCGESEIEPQTHSERRARERIRNRVKNAVLDFKILLRHFEDRDRELIAYEDGNLKPAFAKAPAFPIGFMFYLSKAEIPWFTQDVETGVEQALARFGWLGSAECDLEITPEEKISDISDERIEENLKTLTRKQLRDLLLAGIITDEQFSAEIRRRSDAEE